MTGDEGEKLIQLRVERLAELQPLWLDTFADGGIFVPGLTSVPAGDRVVLHVRYARPLPGSVFLSGTVAIRRVTAGAQQVARGRTSGMFAIRPGVGIAFDASMRARLVFLDRVERGVSHEGRRAPRYPSELAGELIVRRCESARSVTLADIGPHGTRLVAPGIADLVRVGALVRLWVAAHESGASSFAPLAGQVVWVDRNRGDALGLRMVLTSAEDRLHWARVFTRWRATFERKAVVEQRISLLPASSAGGRVRAP